MKYVFFKKDFLRGGLFCVVTSVFLLNCSKLDKQPGTNVEILAASVPVNLVEPIQIQTDTIIPEKDTVLQTYTVVGVGDMMLGTNYPSTSYLPANDGKTLLADVMGILQDADVTFGNLEGTLFDSGGTPKTCRNPDICYVFRTPAKYVDRFLEAGFDALSIANNHSGDFGAEGRRKTKETLKEAGIAFAGLAGTDETVVFERNGVKYGLCAFAPNSGTCDIRNIPKAKQIVEKLAQECDIVIVSFHGGAEGPTHQHVPRKTETYLGENRGDVYAFSHAVIDAGADIVFGHGPHVTRAVELYNDRFIAYSMGNFCTYGRFNLAGPAGVSPIIKLQINGKGEFLNGEIIPTYQQKTHGPKVDAQKRAITIIRELTKADFPETPLNINENGQIIKKEVIAKAKVAE